MTQPWRSVGLITALVASFAVPAFMASTATGFLEAASDSVTQQVLDDEPNGLDVRILATGQLEAEAVAALDDEIRGGLDRVGGLAAPRRFMWFGGPDIGLSTPAASADEPPQPIIGSSARFLADDEAVAALRVVEGDPEVDGLWLSERRAKRLGLSPGAMVVVGSGAGTGDPVPVAGIYANLWEGEQDPFWSDAPSAFAPRFSRVFNGPTFELVVLPEALAYGVGVRGNLRWDAANLAQIETLDELQSRAARIRTLERSFTGSGDMGAAVTGFSGAGRGVPSVATDTFDLRDDVTRIVDELDQPIATTAIGGILLGLVITAAGAAFAVRKRLIEVRLLRADGDAAWRFAARAAVQYLPPAVLGGLLGALVGRWWFTLPGTPGSGGPDSFDSVAVVRAVLAGLVVASLVTAFAASRVLSTKPASVGALRAVWILPVVGLAIGAWIQVGASGSAGEVDPLVVAFPLVGLIAGVSLTIVGARWLMHRVRRTGSGLPPALFLAWRRIAAADSGAILLAGSMGLALGLLVFSSTLTDSLDAAGDAKVTTMVGGATRGQLRSVPEGDLTEATTLIRHQTSALTSGGQTVQLVVIDPATYATGVSWEPTFGGSAADIVAMLEQSVDADLAAVVTGTRPIAASGGVGRSTVFSYEVVGEVASAPLASDTFPTLVVSADQYVDVARADHAAQRPDGVEVDDWADEFRSPLNRFNQMVVSQLDATTLTERLDALDLEVTDVVTRAEQRDLVGTRAARWAFRYLGVLAVIGAIAAAGTLFFYLSERRASRQLSTVMSTRIGLRSTTAAVSAVVEVLGLVVIAFAAGTSTGLLLSSRAFDRFEPSPRVPPDVGLQPAWGSVAALGAGAIVFVVVAALVDHRLSGRRSYGEVLRGG